jgi:putative redox protein
MKGDSELTGIIREHVKKRHEADDEEFLFGAERVDLKHLDHLTMEARKRHFTFLVDEPAERGGTDKGPNPLAYFLAGAASCLMNQYATDAIYRDIKLDKFEITARGHFDRRLGGAFSDMVYDLRITSDASKDQILSLAKEAEEMCYAHNTLKKAGVKMVSNIFLNGQRIN